MNDGDCIKARICSLIDNFPAGSVIWHRANEARGVVQGWEVDVGGSATLIVDYGSNNSSKEYPSCVSSSPMVRDEDNEGWKNGDQEGGTAER